MKTLHILIIASGILISVLTVIAVQSANAVLGQEPPLMISQIELYGPATTQEHSCLYKESISAHQWFELYNPTNSDIRIIGYDLTVGLASNNGFGSSESSAETQIELPPHQKCIYALFAPGQDAIPDPRNVIIKFGYHYAGAKYLISTPPLTDTYNDTRTWKLEKDGTWVFVAPSPLGQIKDGISPEEIFCNQDLGLLINKATHLPACVRTGHMTKLEELGWIKATRPQYIPLLDRTYDSGPGFGCPFIFPHLVITNSSGFQVNNDNGLTHYELIAGHQGTMTFKLLGDSFGLDPPIYSPSKVNVTNGAYFYYESKSGNNSTELNSLYGVTISYEPKWEMVNYNGSVSVTVTISASTDAKIGKYKINLIPGGCAGASFFELDVVNKT